MATISEHLLGNQSSARKLTSCLVFRLRQYIGYFHIVNEDIGAGLLFPMGIPILS